MIEWLKMGGHGHFIWSSYAMLAFAIVVELIALRRHRIRARDRVLEAIDEDSQ
jgi:heme exporter protein CcmD